MAYVFTADAGVRFMKEGVRFERAPELDSGGRKKYRFETSSKSLAARLRKLGEYGITEVKEAGADVDTGDS